MRKHTIIIGIILLVLITLGCIGQTQEPATTPAPETTMPTTTQAPTATTPAPTTTNPLTAQATTTTDAKEIFESKCSACHSINRPKSKTKTRSEWETTVKRMQDTNGARTVAGLTDEDAEKIIDYLAEKYGK